MQIVNIEIEEKTNYTESFQYCDGTTNLPIDITGWSALMQIRDRFGSDVSPLLTLSSPTSIILGGITGVIEVNFTPAMTDQTTQSTGWVLGAYDLILTDLFGKKIKIAKGFVTILRSATI